MVVHLVWGELPLSMLEVWKALSGNEVPNWEAVVWDVCSRMLVVAAGGLLWYVDADVVSQPRWTRCW